MNIFITPVVLSSSFVENVDLIVEGFVQNINVMPGYVGVNNKSMIYPLVELKIKIKWFKFKILLVNSK